MRKTRIFTLVIVITVILTVFSGCAYNTSKTFTADGMNITLTKDFAEKAVDGYTVCYDSPKASVYVVKEDFINLPDMVNNTVEQYATAVRIFNEEFSPEDIQTKDGITYYTLTMESEGTNYKYVSTFFKSDNAFWIIQFGVNENIYADFEEKIFEWAKSVTFA